MRLCSLFILAALVCGCSGKSETRLMPAGTPYVILPANYIIDLAAGSEVTLNPGMREFVIFPSSAEAKSFMSREGLGQEDWRVYRVEGNFSALAEPCGQNRYCLASPARLADWEDS